MITSQAILSRLASAAESFDFPVLDNAYWKFAAARMLGFRSGTEWGLLFEVLVFHTQAGGFSVETYGYGPLVGDHDGFLASVPAIEEVPEHPLWTDDGEWIRSGRFVVSVFGSLVHALSGPVTHGGGDSGRLNIVALAHGDDLDEGAFVRALVRELGLRRMIPSELAFRNIDSLRFAEVVVHLTNWDHPDIAGGEVPNESAALMGVARVLAGEAAHLQYDTSRNNVYWDRWLQTERARSQLHPQ